MTSFSISFTLPLTDLHSYSSFLLIFIVDFAGRIIFKYFVECIVRVEEKYTNRRPRPRSWKYCIVDKLFHSPDRDYTRKSNRTLKSIRICLCSCNIHLKQHVQSNFNLKYKLHGYWLVKTIIFIHGPLNLLVWFQTV